jgi:hypothetical protein
MQNPTTKQPTAEAIETAIRNAAKMSEQGYSVKQSRSANTLWFVVKADPRFWYTVDTLRGTCDCPYFAQEGICKHRVQIDEELRIREMEQAYEDGMTYAQEREEEYRFDHDLYH